ncbi:MAG TPA: helix-turn-helix transcriptional regulator [Rhodopila sp.]|jgi:transcriptional regulator with XRE-family HTH domain|nr:helix-turn-helix transcriptional regulator [Rhodopila sp.]
MSAAKGTIGFRLKTLRHRNTQLRVGDVAEACGISRAYLSTMENGHDLPGRDVLARLADFYHVSSEFLLTGREPLKQGGEFVEDLDELALLDFWRSLLPEYRPMVLTMLRAAAGTAIDAAA